MSAPERNPYAAAVERYERARENYYRTAPAEAGRIMREAGAEFGAAEADLRQYEQSPGIPKPEYRERVTA